MGCIREAGSGPDAATAMLTALASLWSSSLSFLEGRMGEQDWAIPEWILMAFQARWCGAHLCFLLDWWPLPSDSRLW